MIRCVMMILGVALGLSFTGCEKARVNTRNGGDKASKAVPIRTVFAKGKIHVLFGKGGNIAVSVGDDGLLIVDDQYAGQEWVIRNALGALSKGRLAYVLNTHHHLDHTGTNDFFAKRATIIAHDNVRKRLLVDEPADAPVMTFSESLTIHFNGEDVHALHFAKGHTDGDSVVFFNGSDVVHMGDTYFKDKYPLVDLKSGGSVVGLIDIISSVLEKIDSDTVVVPGHGELATKAELERYRDALVSTTTYIAERVQKGDSIEAIQKRGLPDKWRSWGEGYIKEPRWIETVVRSLESDPPAPK